LNPPSAVMVDPVVKLDRSLAKNTAALAISTGSAKRPNGIVEPDQDDRGTVVE